MKQKHRKILNELMGYCNQLGGRLDGTSTNEIKFVDRQRSLMDVYRIIYAVLADHPENDQSEFDFEIAEESLKRMKSLTEKEYFDKYNKKASN